MTKKEQGSDDGVMPSLLVMRALAAQRSTQPPPAFLSLLLSAFFCQLYMSGDTE